MTMPLEPPGSPTLTARLGVRPTIVELGSGQAAVRRVLASAGGAASFLVTLDDDRIEALEVEIGQGHRGVEKALESHDAHAALPFVARLGFHSGPIAQITYCLALEALAKLSVPPRATWLRTLVCELARVADHLGRVASLAAAIGASSAERVAQQALLVASGRLEAAIGGSVLSTWSLPGGVARDLALDFAAAWAFARARIEVATTRLAFLLLDQPSAAGRLVGVAPLAAADALALGVTGPCLRASGIAWDRRLDAPSLGYAELSFDVAVGTQGDDADRLAVVLEEIRQSLSLVDQCLARLADPGLPGPFVASDTVGTPGAAWPVGEAEACLESSTGELGFWIASAGGRTPPRVRCRAPSFFHARALEWALPGARLDDLLPTAALFHLVSPEHDR